MRPKEVEAMIGTAKKVGRHGIRDAAIILLMFRHGLRTAELVALKWSQVDLSEGYIEIHRVGDFTKVIIVHFIEYLML